MNMTTPEPLCRRCGYVDPDIRLMGCSCLLHAVSQSSSWHTVLFVFIPTRRYSGLSFHPLEFWFEIPLKRAGSLRGVSALTHDRHVTMDWMKGRDWFLTSQISIRHRWVCSFLFCFLWVALLSNLRVFEVFLILTMSSLADTFTHDTNDTNRIII